MGLKLVLARGRRSWPLAHEEQSPQLQRERGLRGGGSPVR